MFDAASSADRSFQRPSARAARDPLAADRLARGAWSAVERVQPRDGPLERAWAAGMAIAIAPWSRVRGHLLRAIVPAVERAGAALGGLDDDALCAAARAAGHAALRGDPGRIALAAPLFAAIREVAGRQLGMRHRPVQLMGGLAMLRGQLAEMQTGEGKTLTATLAAGAMALTGRPVHVVTVNDYLAARDANEMGPVYTGLGLSVGVIVQGMEPSERAAAYDCDVTYCTNKELTFDFLRDRVGGAGQAGPLGDKVRAAHDALSGAASARPGLLRGLAFALVDEADSVLIDEARTPLILSAEGPALFDENLLREAAALVEPLGAEDFRIDTGERRVLLTACGQDRLAARAPAGPLSNRVLREDLATKALTAAHLFRRDEHYLVLDDKVTIIDEYTGRTMPDRFWTDGLHQLIELREGVPLSRGRVTLARTTYQRFFRRYDRLAGMTGTVHEVAAEMWRTYRLPVAAIPTHRPVQRRILPARVHARAEAKWAAIAAETERLHEAGIPVLIGARSVAASMCAAQALEARGLPHTVLSAAQDAHEADVIAAAGQPGRITIATNMAGRGADIKLAPGVAALGGLHVIMSEAHDSRRVDRQLSGRAGRQGDPGWFRPELSLEDPLIAEDRSGLLRTLGQIGLAVSPALARWSMRRAQARAESLHARMRRDLMRQDEVLNDAMGFAGTPD